jgi:hypothetical protein
MGLLKNSLALQRPPVSLKASYRQQPALTGMSRQVVVDLAGYSDISAELIKKRLLLIYRGTCG